MSKPRNVIISQSGGPTPVINNSLRGIIETCLANPDQFGTVYAGYHGVEGILREELLDLSAQDRDEIALLRTTPSAGAIGTCRYKLRPSRPQDFERVIDVLKAHDIGYLFYIGGNDSMSTLTRTPGALYNVQYGHVDLSLVANSERTFPQAWLTADRNDVTDDFLRYARPLIGEDYVTVPMINGLMRFTRFKPLYAEKKLPAYQF